MGRKTDTKNIFQIGRKNNNYIWDFKYFEKKRDESNIYIFQSIEIKKFIKKILKDNGLMLHNCKIDFLESDIKIFISYLKLPKSQTIINLISNNQKIKLIKKTKQFESYGKNIKEYLSTKKYLSNREVNLKNRIDLKLNSKFKYESNLKKQKIIIFLLNYFVLNKNRKTQKQKVLLKSSFNQKINSVFEKEMEKKFVNCCEQTLEKQTFEKQAIKKRIKILQYYKYYIKIKNHEIIQNIKINNFLEKVIESLKIFTRNKFNIILNIRQANNNLSYNLTPYQLQHLKKTTIQLRQFKKSKFFKEGLNVIFLSLIEKNSAQLLADFIANQLKLVKQHGFFLKFLKKALSLMLTSKLSRAVSIKMVARGRFNGKRRSGKKMLNINKNMPLMTLNSNINSAQSTAYGSNGTFGVKIWVNEKNT